MLPADYDNYVSANYIHVNPDAREKLSRDKRRSVKRSEAALEGIRGSSTGNFQNPLLQMVQSELFPSYICQYN